MPLTRIAAAPIRTLAACLVLAFALEAAGQPGAIAPIDPFNRQAVVTLYNSAYVAARAVPNDWNGSTASCTAGGTSAAFADATMLSVNYFRAMTGLPSALTRDPVKDAKTQQAALMMSANNALNHFPPTSWLCYTAEGAEAAGKSNLALGGGGLGAGARAIGLYMGDNGVGDLGHRRWILYPPQASLGTGSTSGANALWVLGPFGTRPASPTFVSWPNAGFVPYQLVYSRWSFAVNTSSAVNFSGATVTITRDGGINVPVAVFTLATGYGDPTLGFEPSGLVTGPGVPDQTLTVVIDNVVVGGALRQFTYTVTIIDPGSTPAGTVPGAPTGVAAVAGNAHATVSFVPPSNGGSSPVSSYVVTASPGGATASGPSSPIVVTGLANGTAYTFTVKATNLAGTGPASAPSPPVTPSGSGTAVVGAPTNFAVTANAGNTVSFGWTPGAGTLPITGYVVEGGLTAGSVLGSLPLASTATSFTVDLPTGAYYLRLHALSGATRSVASNEIRVFVNVPVPPAPPTNLLGLVNGDAVWLSWVNSTAGGSPSGIVLDVSGPVSASVPLGAVERFAASGVPPGTYTIRVRAANAAGTSAASNPVTLSVPGPCSGAPGVPVGFSVTTSGRQLTATWLSPSAGPAPMQYSLGVSGAYVGSVVTTNRTVSGTVAPGTYTFTLSAGNVCGTSPPTAAQTVVVP